MIRDFSKNLRPLSLTSTLSKIAESIVITTELKPVILKQVDPNQFGFIPGSSTTFALISMSHHGLNACDSLNTDVKTVLLDFKKAFDFVDHTLPTAKLYSLSVKPTVGNWIIEFLREEVMTKSEVKFKLFLKLADCSSGSTPRYMPRTLAVPCND